MTELYSSQVDINPFFPIIVEHLSYLTWVTDIWTLKYPVKVVSYLTLNNIGPRKGRISPHKEIRYITQ